MKNNLYNELNNRVFFVFLSNNILKIQLNMKNMSLLLIVLCCTIFVSAQTNDEKTKFVRKHYQLIEKDLPNCTVKEYTDQPNGEYSPFHYYTFWVNKHNQLIKAFSTYGEEGYGTEISYYFHNENIIFIYTVDFEPNWDQEEFALDKYETRTYLYDKKVFNVLAKTVLAGDKRKYIPNEKTNFNESDLNKSISEEVKALLNIYKRLN